MTEEELDNNIIMKSNLSRKNEAEDTILLIGNCRTAKQQKEVEHSREVFMKNTSMYVETKNRK